MRALDLFCGAGGAGMGLHRAGFEVVGVDLVKQKNYPFAFVQADALNPPFRLADFDLVWASPPCQGYTTMSNKHRNREAVQRAPKLINEVRTLLAGARTWVIENVQGARAHMPGAFSLSGSDFGLAVRRTRLFETNFLVLRPSRSKAHANPVAVYGPPDGRRLWDRADGTQLRAWRLDKGRAAMEMPWADADGIRQAIPPAYSQHIAEYALLALNGSTPAARANAEPGRSLSPNDSGLDGGGSDAE